MKTVVKQKEKKNLSTVHKNFFKGLILFFIAIIMTLIGCDSNADINGDGIEDPCENGRIFAMRTAEHWSGSSLETGALKEDYSDYFAGAVYATALVSDFPITSSNSSTYNQTEEIYHYFASASKQFVNMTLAGPETVATLASVAGSTYSGIVYVSLSEKYYLVEIDAAGNVKLIEVNPTTGAIISTIDTGLDVPSGTFDTFRITEVSIATDNQNKVYILVNKFLISVDLITDTPTVYTLDALGETTKFHGIEFRNSGYERIIALRTDHLGNTHLVTIDPASPLSYELSADVTTSLPALDINLNTYGKYSTALTCDENTYVISHLQANTGTKFVRINLSSYTATATTVADVYYFGLESNGNN